MLAMHALQASYGHSQVLFDLTLTVAEGEVVSLMGRNGMGKTTTLRCLFGLMPSQGSITFRGRTLTAMPSHAIARLGIGLVPEGRQVFPTLTVRENLIATARPGPAGTEKDEKPFVRLTSNKKYSTSSDVATATGSSNVVFNDGSVQVYEVSEVTATAKTGFKGVESDAKQWGAIKSTTNYTTSSSPPEGGSVNIIYNDGAVTVYEATETVPSVAGSSKDVEPREWGSLIWDGTFGTTTSDEKSTQVWSNGVNQVYKNEKATLVVKSGSFVSKKEVNPLYTETITSSFSTSPSISGAVGESSAVFSIADKVVYENRIIEVSSSTTRYYGTVVRYPVPATLIGIERSDFPRRDGTLEIHYRAIIAEGTDGYMPAKVIEKFEKVPSGPTKPIKSFKPSPVAFTTPYGSFSVGATLHGDLSFWITTGTTDPIYEYIYQPVSIPATVPPTTAGFGDVLVSYTSEPFKDGFITREVYVTF